MTMQHQIHPDDERLAALAGGDADATADAGLRAHVAACDRCAPVVAELRQLRTALAELPDLAPSRPLQLVPPVPAPEQRAAPRGWLRRLAGPMMAAGAGLVLVGAVGSVGSSGVFESVGQSLSGGAAAAPSEASAEDEAQRPGAGRDLSTATLRAPTPQGGAVSGVTASPSPGLDRDRGSTASEKEPETPPAPLGGRNASGEPGAFSPWVVVLLVGVVFLFAGGTILVAKRPQAS